MLSVYIDSKVFKALFRGNVSARFCYLAYALLFAKRQRLLDKSNLKTLLNTTASLSEFCCIRNKHMTLGVLLSLILAFFVQLRTTLALNTIALIVSSATSHWHRPLLLSSGIPNLAVRNGVRAARFVLVQYGGSQRCLHCSRKTCPMRFCNTVDEPEDEEMQLRLNGCKLNNPMVDFVKHSTTCLQSLCTVLAAFFDTSPMCLFSFCYIRVLALTNRIFFDSFFPRQLFNEKHKNFPNVTLRRIKKRLITNISTIPSILTSSCKWWTDSEASRHS